MQQSKTHRNKRSPADRRLSDRRCFDKGYNTSGKERRKEREDRRKGWEYFPKDWPC